MTLSLITDSLIVMGHIVDKDVTETVPSHIQRYVVFNCGTQFGGSGTFFDPILNRIFPTYRWCPFNFLKIL